jgi:hypothetical protein
MAWHAGIRHVPARQLEVGAADTGRPHAHYTFARRRPGLGPIAADNQTGIEQQRAHGSDSNQKIGLYAMGAHTQSLDFIYGRDFADAR